MKKSVFYNIDGSNYNKKTREKKLKAVSNPVWVLIWNAVITEKTIKKEWNTKSYSNDNYNTIIIDHTILTKFSTFNFER